MDAARSGILAVAEQVADRLDLGPVDAAVGTFLRCLGDEDTGCAVGATAVSSSGVPAEFSFTGSPSGARALRLLSEPLEPGAGAVARCASGLRSLELVLERTGVYADPPRAVRAAAEVFPPGCETSGLSWNAAVWLGLRTDGRRTGVRAYLNMHNRPVGDRYARAGALLEALSLADDVRGLPGLAAIVGGWADPIGISLDFAGGAVRTARVHFNVRSLAYRRLSLLMAQVSPGRRADLLEFLHHFGLGLRAPAPNLLLSVGLERGVPNSVKCDVTVGGTDGHARGPRLDRLEERFGPVPGRRATQDVFADAVLLRYVGLTVGRAEAPYLNVYYSAPRLHVDPPAENRPAGGGARRPVVEARSVHGGPAAGGDREAADAVLRGVARLVEGAPADPTATWLALVGGSAENVAPAGTTVRRLQRWLQTPGMPACPAGCRSLVPLYLAARSPLLAELGPGAAEALRAELRRRRRPDGSWGGSGPETLDTALAVLILGALGALADLANPPGTPDGPAALAALLRTQQYGDGGWCWAPVQCDGHGTWYGSRTVTTRVALAALAELGAGEGEIGLVGQADLEDLRVWHHHRAHVLPVGVEHEDAAVPHVASGA